MAQPGVVFVCVGVTLSCCVDSKMLQAFLIGSKRIMDPHILPIKAGIPYNPTGQVTIKHTNALPKTKRGVSSF